MDTRAPAPWHLRGSGYVFLFRSGSRAAGEARPLPGFTFSRGLGAVMLLDYTESDVGPYRELLFIPGTYARGRRRFYSISRIFVSTQVSVDNGRENWAIPKEVADFEVTPEGRDERVRVSSGGRLFFDARLRSGRVRIPASTRLVPAFLRTLCQIRDGRLYFTAPSGGGRVTRAHIEDARIDQAMFPDFVRYPGLLSVHVSDLRMHFPVATVEEDERREST